MELRAVEEKLRQAEEENSSMKTKLLSFTKAMGSLQDDRDRVLNMYKQLEEKHLEVRKREKSQCLHVYLCKKNINVYFVMVSR